MIQKTVYNNVARRGYLDDMTPDHIINRQVLKSLEEFGEVARHLFDGKRPPVTELADVVIPLLVIAEECGYDLLAAIERKSADDISRGVRMVVDGGGNDTSPKTTTKNNGGGGGI